MTLTALGEGAQRYVVDQFASIGTNLLIVVPGKSETTGIPGVGGATHDLTLQDVQTIARTVPGDHLTAVGKPGFTAAIIEFLAGM